MDCPLIVLCSGAAQEADFPGWLRRQMVDHLVVWQLPARGGSALPVMWSAHHRLSGLYRSSDLGLKRNLALALATIRAWSRLLFVDDDITTHDVGETLDANRLSDALQAMHDDIALRTVGWPVHEYPDNSVIGHARRLVDEEQDTFVGGGALLVRCDAKVPFFPDIFNEDWLFLIASALVSPDYRKTIACAGSVGQLEYEPFRVVRAQAEEAGDIIGEGLMNLLQDDGPACAAPAKDQRYWFEAMRVRREFIGQLIETGREQQQRPKVATRYPRVHTSLCAARDVHQLIRPEDITGYVHDWLRDLGRWNAYLDVLATRGRGAGEDPALVLDCLMGHRNPRRRPSYRAWAALVSAIRA